MAKSRDRQKDELSLPRVGNDGSRGVRSSPPGRRKVLLIAGAAPLSRGLWPNRSWRLDDARRSQKGRPGRGEARRSARGAARGPSRGRERPAPQDLSPAEAGHGVVKRRSLQAAQENIRAGWETREARVLVVNVLGSRRRSDASRVARHDEPQGKSCGRR